MDFFLANSADPDEMPHNAAFHLGLHCLQKYWFSGYQSFKGLKECGTVFYVIKSFIQSFQEKDLKQYMDDCGNIMSMTNVKVSNSHSFRRDKSI